MSNPFDQFDAAPVAAPVAAPAPNPFDAFDANAVNHPQAGPSGSTLTDAARLAGTGLAGGLGVAAALPRAITQGVDYLGNLAGVNLGADQGLASIQRPQGGSFFPDASTARERAFAMTGGTEYMPSSTSGRMLKAGLEAIPMGAITGGATILPSIAGSAAGEGAAELFPNHPLIARMVGFMAGAHGAQAATNGLTKTAGMVTGTAPTSEMFQAYKRQGIPTDLSGDVTQNPSLQMAQMMAARMPGGSEAIAEKGAKAITAWQDAAERSAQQLGPSATLEQAGQGLQSAANDWLQNFKDQSNQNWAAFKQQVPGDTHVPVTNYAAALNNIQQDFGGATATAQALQSGLPSRLREALSSDVSQYGTLPWKSVQATRSAIGELLQGAPIADAPQAALKRLYSGLSQDMQDGATSISPQAAEAFNSANAYTRTGHALLDEHINPILRATNPEAAAQYALSQAKIGGSRLEALNGALPSGVQDVGAAKLRIAAANGPGGLPTMLKGMSPEAQDQLLGPASQNINDLNMIAQGMRRTVQAQGNNSGSSAHATAGLGRLMTAMEFAKEGKEMAGVPGAIAGGALGIFAPNVIGGTARAFGANSLLSRIYSTEAPQAVAPSMSSPNALLALSQPDQRTLPGAQARNPLLFDPGTVASGSTRAIR